MVEMLSCEALQSLSLIETLPKGLLDQLLSQNDLNVQDEVGNSVLHHAAEQGIDGSIITLVQAGCDMNIVNHDLDSPFMKAIGKCSLKSLRIIVDYGADVNLQNRFGYTPLMTAVLSTNVDTVEFLLNQGAAVNAQNQMNSTALHLACGRGLTDCIKILARAKADLDIQDNEGMTPATWAVGQGHLNVIKILRNLGCDLSKRDYKGNTLLHEAVSLGQLHMLQYLIDEKCIDKDTMNRNGVTPLTEAARCARTESIEVLLKAGCDVNTGTLSTPLIESAYFGDYKNAELLLAAAANPNLTSTKYQTPLYWSIVCKHPNLVKLLLQANADINNVYVGNSAVYIAAAKGCWKELEILCEAGCNMNKVFKDSHSVTGRVTSPRKLPAKINKCPWLLPALANPRTLKVLSREIIRNCLGPSPKWKIYGLPIPNQMKQFLALENL